MICLSNRYVLFFILNFLCFFNTSCTFNIIQTDTHGYADDVVDSDPSTDVKPQTDLTIPFKPI